MLKVLSALGRDMYRAAQEGISIVELRRRRDAVTRRVAGPAAGAFWAALSEATAPDIANTAARIYSAGMIDTGEGLQVLSPAALQSAIAQALMTERRSARECAALFIERRQGNITDRSFLALAIRRGDAIDPDGILTVGNWR